MTKARPGTYREAADPSEADSSKPQERKPLKLSREEAVALLQMEGVAQRTSWYDELWPRTSLPGLLGVLDAVLAAMTLPLVLGMGVVLYFHKGDGEGLWERPGLFGLLGLMGGLVFMWIAWEFEFDHWGWPMTYAAWVALVGRTQLTRFSS